MTLDDYREYWSGRLTDKEKADIVKAIRTAHAGMNPAPENTADLAVEYAIRHQFYRNSVVPVTDLEITAMERCMGAALPEDIRPEAVRQGLLVKDGDATTKEVLAQEGRIIDFAQEGKGTMRPLGLTREGSILKQRPTAQSPLPAGHTATLSAEQQAAIRHIWTSSDQVILIRGGAGTGKTTMMKAAIAGIDRPVAVLAPSSNASRTVLREEGFKDANTVAAFLGDEKWQARMKGGVIWVDEAGLLPVQDLDRLSAIAKDLDARIVLQGDHKQHKSVARHGNMFRVLQEYAGLKLAELKDIKRQKGLYKEAVDAIQKGDILKGHDILAGLGCIKQVEGSRELVDDYMAARNAGKSALVVSPTHAQGDIITQEIRARLRQEGTLGNEEKQFTQLRNLGWSDAQKADLAGYEGTEVVQFFRNSGPFRAGQKAGAGDLHAEQERRNARKRGPKSKRPVIVPEHFSVYAPGHIGLSAGDAIRITAGGKTKDGKRLDNGDVHTVAGFTKEGDIALTNGWTIDKKFGHIAHAYTSTSFGAQGKTVDRVLIAMGSQSAPALNAEQFYVSASRGRESATIYTDMQPAELRSLIKREDTRKSATELMKPKRQKKNPHIEIRKRAQEHVRRLLIEQQLSDKYPVIAHEHERRHSHER